MAPIWLLFCILPALMSTTVLVEAQGSFVDFALSNGFGETARAVSAANLDGTLSDPTLRGTIFAPTNAGWAVFTRTVNTTMDRLLSDPTTLANILRYHVIPDRVVRAQGLAAGARLVLRALDGGEVDVRVARDGSDIEVTGFGDAGGSIVSRDLAFNNVIVHGIDGVLRPA